MNQITFVRNNLYEISCHVDVLESYKDSILNLNCRIERQSKEYNLLLPDNDLTICCGILPILFFSALFVYSSIIMVQLHPLSTIH